MFGTICHFRHPPGVLKHIPHGHEGTAVCDRKQRKGQKHQGSRRLLSSLSEPSDPCCARCVPKGETGGFQLYLTTKPFFGRELDRPGLPGTPLGKHCSGPLEGGAGEAKWTLSQCSHSPAPGPPRQFSPLTLTPRSPSTSSVLGRQGSYRVC